VKRRAGVRKRRSSFQSSTNSLACGKFFPSSKRVFKLFGPFDRQELEELIIYKHYISNNTYSSQRSVIHQLVILHITSCNICPKIRREVCVRRSCRHLGNMAFFSPNASLRHIALVKQTPGHTHCKPPLPKSAATPLSAASECTRLKFSKVSIVSHT